MSTQELSLDEMNALPIALRTVTGSEVHNINVGESSDRDETAFYVPTPQQALGLGETVEIYRYRTAYERRGEKDYHSSPKSQKGDLDFNAHDIRHWAMLAIAGNPSALTPLYVEPKWIVDINEIGREARDNRDRFISTRFLTNSYGYMQSQYEKMVGIRKNTVNRQDLVDLHGFDTKFGGHMIRLAVQALSVARGGELEIPVNPKDAHEIRRIRSGEYTREEVVKWYLEMKDELGSILESGSHGLSEDADYQWVNDWVVRSILS